MTRLREDGMLLGSKKARPLYHLPWLAQKAKGKLPDGESNSDLDRSYRIRRSSDKVAY